jgi:hypothetical protein
MGTNKQRGVAFSTTPQSTTAAAVAKFDAVLSRPSATRGLVACNG